MVQGIKDLRQIEIGFQVDCDTEAVAAVRLVGRCGMKKNIPRVFPSEPTGLMSSNILTRFYDPWVMAELPLTPGEEGLTFEQFPYYLAMGAVGGVTGPAWAFIPDLVAGDLPSLATIRYGDNAGVWQSECCFARQLVISASSQSPWQIEADVIGRDMVVSAFTPEDYPVALETILGQMTTFFVDDTCAAFGTGDILGSLIDWRLTIPGFHPKFFQDGMLQYSTMGLASRHLTLEATVEWDDTFAAAEHADWILNTPRYMRIEAAGAAPNLATIDLVVHYESFETLDERDGNDTIKFVARTAYDDACVAVPEWSITVTNSDAALP